eukprot:scaffold34.g4511.t1
MDVYSEFRPGGALRQRKPDPPPAPKSEAAPGDAPKEQAAPNERPVLLRTHPALTQPYAQGEVAAGGRLSRSRPLRMYRDALPTAPLRAVPAWKALVMLAVLVAIGYVIVRFADQGTEFHHAGTLFTPEELRKYDGGQSHRIYLAVMGQVYDVTHGRKHYGIHGGYAVFAAVDASRAYITGKFKEDLTDDVADFTPEQFEDLVGWREFYAKHSRYRAVGKVVGRFYDSDGQATPLLASAEAQAAAVRAAKEDNKQQARAAGWLARLFAATRELAARNPCNVVAPDELGTLHERCACFLDALHSQARRLYDGCEPSATRCRTSSPAAEAAATARDAQTRAAAAGGDAAAEAAAAA